MNILFWVLQVIIAFFCIAGAMWRFKNFDKAAQGVPSIRALSRRTWNAINAFEIICSVGLIVPMALGWMPVLTPIAATLLAAEHFAMTGWHMKFFGFKFRAANPAAWSVSLGAASALLAVGRFCCAG